MKKLFFTVILVFFIIVLGAIEVKAKTYTWLEWNDWAEGQVDPDQAIISRMKTDENGNKVNEIVKSHEVHNDSWWENDEFFLDNVQKEVPVYLWFYYEGEANFDAHHINVYGNDRLGGNNYFDVTWGGMEIEKDGYNGVGSWVTITPLMNDEDKKSARD